MRQFQFSLCAIIAAILAAPLLTAATTIPAPPDHVVIVIEENHGYSEIIGSSNAPYINSLAQNGAIFNNSFAITHPSEPNYLALFSGSTQGVRDDGTPPPIRAPNLGGELLAKGRSFIGYSEDLPYAGFNGSSSGNYYRKHNPWVNFPDIPASSNLPLTNFPSDFAALPTVAIVVPNQINDMHDGSIATADTWLHGHLDAYAQWAMTHNSLLILTFDEDDSSQDNRIPTIFCGQMVKQGIYAEVITHYSVLRTLQEMYRLAPIAESANAAPILDVWTQTLTSPTMNTTGILIANFGDALNFSIPFTGSTPVVLSAKGLPPFLTLNGSTLSGVANAHGSFNFQISATNYAGTQTLQFRMDVLPVSQSNLDTDGDGFPDEIETFLHTDPQDASSTPLGGSPATLQAFPFARLVITLDFAHASRDSLNLTGTLQVSGAIAGQKILIDVGGVIESFQLNARGTAKSSDGSLRVSTGLQSGASAHLSLRLAHTNLAAFLADEGLIDATLQKQKLSIPVVIFFDGILYKTILTQRYWAQLHRGGRSKR